MRRSKEIPACLLLLAASTSLLSCRESRDCVDASGHKMPDSYCDKTIHPGSRVVYGGSSGGHIGDVVTGGRSGASESDGVSRGGFGSGEEGSEGGHGGGEGEGE